MSASELTRFWRRWHTAASVATNGEYLLMSPNHEGQLELFHMACGHVIARFAEVPALDELFAEMCGDCTCPQAGEHEPCPTCAALLRAMEYEPLPQGVPLAVGLARG
jgi:hypothetical protein